MYAAVIVRVIGRLAMNRAIEHKLRCIAYRNKGLNKHLCTLKKSLDEVSEILCSGKKKKK